MLNQKIKILLVTSLILCLNSCKNYPKIDDQEQLSPYFEYIVFDGKKYIDMEKSVCFARNYKISKEFIGPTTKAIELNIDECNKMVGYAPTEYATFSTWMDDFRIWLNEL